MSAGVALFAVAGRFEVAVVLLLLSGLGSSTFSAFQSTIILGAASERLRGRAMGALTLAIGTAPIGLLEIGALTTIFGAPAAVAANATLCALLIVLTAARLPEFRRTD